MDDLELKILILRKHRRYLIAASLVLLVIIIIMLFVGISILDQTSNILENKYYGISNTIIDLAKAVLPNFVAALIATIASVTIVSWFKDEDSKVERESLITKLSEIVGDKAKDEKAYLDGDLIPKLQQIVDDKAKSEREQLIAEIRNIVSAQKMTGIAQVLNPSEIETFINSISIKKGSTIQIMTTWFPDTTIVKNILNIGIRKKAKIDILHLDPKSQSFEERHKTLRHKEGEAEGYYNDFAKLLKVLLAESPDIKNHVTIRLYDEAPSVRLYRFDNIAVIAFFAPRLHASKIPNLQIYNSGYGGLFETVNEDFKERFKSSKKEWDFEKSDFVDRAI